MPDSARGRISALMMVLSQGAMTLGAVVWGLSAEIAGSRFTLLAAEPAYPDDDRKRWLPFRSVGDRLYAGSKADGFHIRRQRPTIPMTAHYVIKEDLGLDIRCCYMADFARCMKWDTLLRRATSR